MSRIDGLPPPTIQFSYVDDGRIKLYYSDIETLKLSKPVNVTAVKKAFGSASTELLNWPQEIGGNWIERPELDHLIGLIKACESSVTVLLSEPGGGKSAILARLGKRLKSDETIILAIKADRLPKCTATLSDLEKWIGIEISAKEALSRLAKSQQVVVLIDQLDALSELMDQHTERLESVIQLVNSIRDIQNLFVLVSCREFEFRNDVRFSSLNASKVSLRLPEWELVAPIPKSTRI